MPCLVGLVAFFFPRVVIVLMALVGDYIGRAFTNDLWALLGFFFAPYTVLAYSYAINANGSVDGLYLALVIVAALFDLGVLGGGGKATSKVARRRNRK